MQNPLMCVPPADVAKLWPGIGPLIEAAYAAVDEYMPSDLLARLERGESLAWVAAPDGDLSLVVITSLRGRPSGRACQLTVCSGSALSTLGNWLPQIEEYARAEGCVKGYADGRAGWARVLPGYVVKRVTVEKLL